jgi:hypothetical protein
MSNEARKQTEELLENARKDVRQTKNGRVVDIALKTAIRISEEYEAVIDAMAERILITDEVWKGSNVNEIKNHFTKKAKGD